MKNNRAIVILSLTIIEEDSYYLFTTLQLGMVTLLLWLPKAFSMVVWLATPTRSRSRSGSKPGLMALHTPTHHRRARVETP